MDKQMLKEILAAHADQLVTGQTINEDYRQLLPDDDPELVPLLTVAERIQSTLQPVAPPHEFEKELKRQLLATAHMHQQEGYQPPHPFRDLAMFLAAIAAVMALVGVIVIAQRRR